MDNWLQLLLFIFLLIVAIPLLGKFLAVIFRDNHEHSVPILGRLEQGIYQVCGVDPEAEMRWREYAIAVLYFNFFGFLLLAFILSFQHVLPFNPQGFPGVPLALTFNIAMSFVTNTNWQSYGGENTLSYFSQMVGLTTQNFLSAATGNAVLLALIRGIVRQSSSTIGNFWRDLTRTVVYLLLPFSIIFAFILVSQGVVQSLSPYVDAITLEGVPQTIPLGPVASQVAIKQLGTNGGGFFNANSAHPFENPTLFSNFLEVFAIVLIPAAATQMFGLMTRSTRHGAVLFIVMFLMWFGGLLCAAYATALPDPVLGIEPVMEGKETRFGVSDSVLWAITTTATSNGSVNAMIESLSPLAGGIAMFNIMLGEVIFGGVGVGLCGMVMFVLLTVFLAGLMVGRTPEYFGKKIGKPEMQWVMLSILMPPALILVGSGVSSVMPIALESVSQEGPHGLSEILYAFSSAAGNNGSAFAGLNANTDFYNYALGSIMFITRLTILIPSLAIAGLLAEKTHMAPSVGTFATDGWLFGVLLMAVILIVGGLTFFPALSLGPFVEHLLMLEGRAF